MIRRVQAWINENSTIATLVAFVCIVIAVYAIYRVATPTSRVRTPWPAVYCYDLNTGKLFTAPRNKLPPFPTSSDDASSERPAGVWAQVYSCGDCANEADRFVGWLEKFNDETKASLQEMLNTLGDNHGELNPLDALNLWDQSGLLIASPSDAETWIPQTEEDAHNLQHKARSRCVGSDLKHCSPTTSR